MRIRYQLNGANYDITICSLITPMEMVGVVLGYIGATHGAVSSVREICIKVVDEILQASALGEESVELGELLVRVDPWMKHTP